MEIKEGATYLRKPRPWDEEVSPWSATVHGVGLTSVSFDVFDRDGKRQGREYLSRDAFSRQYVEKAVAR